MPCSPAEVDLLLRAPDATDRRTRRRLASEDHRLRTRGAEGTARFLPVYPDIEIAPTVEAGLVDIVTEPYDAGVRFGDPPPHES